MQCPKCGSSVEQGSAFCTNCGAKLVSEVKRESPPSPRQEAPVRQEARTTKEVSAKEVSALKEASTKQAQKVVKNIKSLIKTLSLGEKIIAIGAILGFISFFLPWVSNPEKTSESLIGKDFGIFFWLLPFLMLLSLGLLYFSRGASARTKLKFSFYQVVIGTMFATGGIVLMSAISRTKNWFLKPLTEVFESLSSYMGYYGGSASEEMSKEFEKLFQFEFGIWILIFASLAILIGALLVQRENLK